MQRVLGKLPLAQTNNGFPLCIKRMVILRHGISAWRIRKTYTWLTGKNDTIRLFVYSFRIDECVVDLCDMAEYQYVFCPDPDRTLYPIDVDVEGVVALDNVFFFLVAFALNVHILILR